MFARGATPGKVKTWSYNEEEEDFTKGTCSQLPVFGQSNSDRCNCSGLVGPRSTQAIVS